ncbi:hypothetical protein [Macromonas nakdongensis]|uniref:hypothetical protein n=1 Tax=Macromonas nakdongensis TaxID=1843082 RepID=UPI0018E3B1DA|nr:hypothetical protein [Macromonas nakdongensis]
MTHRHRWAHRARAALLAMGMGAGLALPAAAQTVRCHVSYGGVTKVFAAPPVSNPYDAPVQAEGSFFLFRAVNQVEPLDLASVKVYVYAALDSGPRLIHQGSWLASQTPQSGARTPHGFTGLHAVYEPVRDGELHYWCERVDAPAR